MIIKSLLDNDFYSFSQMNAVYSLWPTTMVKYKFKCRNNPNPFIDFSYDKMSEFLGDIDAEISKLCKLRFHPDEIDYLKSLKLFDEAFLHYLKTFSLHPKQIVCYDIYNNETGSELVIEIEGPWLSTILFEVPVLAIISELYGRRKTNTVKAETIGFTNIKKNITIIETGGFKFVDFGTRRRFSKAWQEKVLKEFIHTPYLAGTSNVMFAKELKLKPIGTMSHQWLMAYQQLVKLEDFQSMALQIWAEQYRGKLGIALSDIIGFDAFLKDFDLYFAKLYDGCRHDSGNPFEWGEKLITHYESMGIDPKIKTAVFSDGLNFQLMSHLYKHFKDRINVSFGIGTNLTNDVGIEPLQIVIKMVECNHKPVAKISDSKGKGMCNDKEFLAHLKKTFKIEG